MSQEQFIENAQKQRSQFLKVIHGLSLADTTKFLHHTVISPLMNGTAWKELYPVALYLHKKGLVDIRGDGVFITTEGIDAVENPSAGTQAVTGPVTHNTINAPNFTQGAIQQNSNHSTQTVYNTSTVTNPDLSPLIEKLLVELPEQSISDEDKEEIETLLRTLKQQSKKAEPNTSLMAEAGKSVRTIMEALTVGALQPGFIVMVHQMLTALPHS